MNTALRRATVAVLAAGALLAIAGPTSAQAPALTATRIDCTPIDYGDSTFHSTASLSCVDQVDSIEFRFHDLGSEGGQWLDVVPFGG
jgi:hypothetical protein